MFDVAEFLNVAVPPADLDESWFESAVDGVSYVKDNSLTEDIIIYASVGQAWIFGVLAPVADLASADLEEIQGAHAGPDGSWALAHVSGGGNPDQIYLSAPLQDCGCKALERGEQLVFRRSFDGVDKHTIRTEISQSLVQALGLYWLEEESAYCKLDDDGDIEPIIRLLDLSKQTGRKNDVAVTINAHQIHRYMAVTDTELVIKFDFTRFRPKAFGGWSNPTRGEVVSEDLYHHSGVQNGCSFVNGVLVVRKLLTKQMLIDRSRKEWNDEEKEYATFKAHDWKNDRFSEISCSPDALASYFEKDSPLPYQVTPAFFRPEVLLKYKSDPDKYALEHRSVTCRGSWYLKSYDVNEAGQVHAYLCDLQRLPYKEQLYWQSFNEWPKGPISRRAIDTDILGNFSSHEDPLLEIKYEVEKIDGLQPDWWIVRGKRLASTLHYPITASVEEWANAILILDQLVIEGFAPKALKKRLRTFGCPIESNWGSVRLLQECLIAQGVDEDDTIQVVQPLKTLHFLRTKVKGHSSESEKQRLVKQAKVEHGSLAAHFRSLAADVRSSFDRIIETL